MDSALGGGLVLLAEEEETLASLGGPGSDVVGNISNLVGLEVGGSLQVNSIRAEPEELLGVNEVPVAVSC